MVFFNGSRLEFNDSKQKLTVFSHDTNIALKVYLVKCELYTTFLP